MFGHTAKEIQVTLGPERGNFLVPALLPLPLGCNKNSWFAKLIFISWLVWPLEIKNLCRFGKGCLIQLKWICFVHETILLYKWMSEEGVRKFCWNKLGLRKITRIQSTRIWRMCVICKWRSDSGTRFNAHSTRILRALNKFQFFQCVKYRSYAR